MDWAARHEIARMMSAQGNSAAAEAEYLNAYLRLPARSALRPDCHIPVI
jgi:hypothetical protein